MQLPSLLDKETCMIIAIKGNVDMLDYVFKNDKRWDNSWCDLG